jgi:hypothetical protein
VREVRTATGESEDDGDVSAENRKQKGEKKGKVMGEENTERRKHKRFPKKWKT